MEEENEEFEIGRKDIIDNLRINWELLSDIEKRQFLLKFVDNIRVVNEVEQGRRKGITRIMSVAFHNPLLEKERRTPIRSALNKTNDKGR